MFVSRSSKIVSWAVKELSRGIFTYVARKDCAKSISGWLTRPLFNHQLQGNSFLSPMPQQYTLYSTSLADSAQSKENDEKENCASSSPKSGITGVSGFTIFNFVWRALSDQLTIHQGISVAFVDKDGEEKHIKVPIGMSMLEAAHENDIELEGACEGSLACSTCHVIVMDTEYYNKLNDPTDEENDMLDLAFGLTETSRLGCQVIARPELDGIRLAIPAATRNFAVDGYVPKPH